jgi:hypothetical protein
MANQDMKNLARRLIGVSLGDLVEFKNEEKKEEKEENADTLDMKFTGKPGALPQTLYERILHALINTLVVVAGIVEILLIIICVVFACLTALDIYQNRGNLSFESFLGSIGSFLTLNGYTLAVIIGVFLSASVGVLFFVTLKKICAFLEMIYLRLNISKNYGKTKDKLAALDAEDEKRKREKETNQELRDFLKQAERGKDTITPHPKL